MGKLKPLPDLTQLTVAENPLADLSHARLYLVFHLRTLEVIDGQQVQNKEREHAKNRFEQGIPVILCHTAESLRALRAMDKLSHKSWFYSHE